ncbi:MAG: beta-phosphoglucomutase [Xanthomonadaceae bacterium]|nr:beta-phosphoglucomutase [Xanthomonadaceae bacterium]
MSEPQHNPTNGLGRQTLASEWADAFDEFATSDPWCFARGRIEAATAERDQTLFCLANGRIGVRGGAEEGGGSGGCFIAQVHERTPIHYHERFTGFARFSDTRLPVADGTRIDIHLGQFALDPRDHTCIVHERRLDLYSGQLRRHAVWQCPGGGRVELTATRVVPFAHQGLVCLRLCLRSIDYHGPVRLDSMLRGDREAPAQGDDPRFGAGVGLAMRLLDADPDPHRGWLLQATPSGRTRVVCMQQHRADVEIAGETRSDEGGVSQTFSTSLAPGQSVTLDKFIAYAWQADADDATDALLRERASALLDRATAAGFEAALEAQQSVMAEFWRDAAIDVDGDPQDQLALRFNLFHLLQSSGRDGIHTAAKGLTGEGYEGHHFWDSEVYVLPVLAMTAPALARSMLEYRYRTLDHARAHAREMNHARGALYAWRTIGGDECSAYFPTGSAQYHINAAIAYAIRFYMDATDDLEFLADAGAEMLFETARLWLQVGHFNPRRGGAFCIDGVTGPDEYSALVDNNHYTNRMARAHLRDAAAVWQRLARERPQAHARLQGALGLTDNEVQQWRRAADAMHLPFDPSLGIVAQDDGFLDKPLWDFAGTDPAQYPLLLHFHPLTLYRHQVCKQADAVLALVLDGAQVPLAVKRASYDYYAKVTVHDSTLSASAFSVLASELDLADEAWRHFQATARVDLDDLHGNTDHGAHMAAMAGSWHCLVFGFAGLRVIDGTLHFAPRLPGAWRGYRVALCWRGRRLELRVDAGGAQWSLADGAPLPLVAYGEALTLSSAQPLQRDLPAAARWPLLRTTVPIEAVIFDLDGVLTDTARVHYTAWQRLADELGISFDRDVNRRLKGVDRLGSLEILLERAPHPCSDAEKAAWCERKNRYYVAAIERFGPGDLLAGAASALRAVRAAGLKVGLASASRNAPLLLQRLGIADAFDFVADASAVTRGKPDPEIFLAAARGLGVAPQACLGVEDAAAGVAAIKAAGMSALGIGDRHELAQADAVLARIAEFRIEAVRCLDAGESEARAPAHVDNT